MPASTSNKNDIKQQLSFIDAHHHLWDLEACNYPWLMAKGEERFFGDPTPIQRNYLWDEFIAESPRFRPQTSVYIQVGVAAEDNIAESKWVDSLPEGPSAIVAACELAGGQREMELDEQCRISGVRGVRQILGRHPVEDLKHQSDALIDDNEFFRGLKSLAERNLSFDLQLIPPQMERVARLLERVPELKVALCHAGSPWDQSAEGLEYWQQGLARLAENPNVVCKLSGLGMFNRDWSVQALQPITDAVLETFGPARVMAGSNFPVDKLYHDYTRYWDALETLLAHLSPAERKSVFQETAQRFYRISLDR